MSSNLPPGCSVSDIPGNRPMDLKWEGFEEWALDKLCALPIDEAERAVLIGLAAVEAERAKIRDLVRDAAADAAAAVRAEEGREQS